jgi:uncharacterized Zn finger protein
VTRASRIGWVAQKEDRVAKTEPRGGNPGKKGRSPAAGWAKLTWDDLERWAGSRSVSRGRTYQRGGRVKDLKISSDGDLLATVVGGDRYATTVALSPGRKRPSLESSCTCPVGISCKHAVAAVAEYLQAVADGRELPVATEDDPRWAKLESDGAESDDDWDEDEGDDASWDDEDAEEFPVKKARSPKRPARRGATPASWDDKIEQHLRAKSQSELADLVWSLTRRFPEIYQEFRERIALQEGDVARLLAEARREIRQVTSEPAWRNHWNDEGHTPDYSRIRHRFERLLELGHADEVVSLGREFIQQGLRQVGESHDEGETATAFAECLPVVFQAVTRSSLSGPERLLFAIDAELADDYDAIGDTSAAVLDAPSKPEDWAAVADTLAGRLKTASVGGEAEEDRFSRHYQRDRVTDWIATALREAGRDEELRGLYESEARVTGSYERLVNYLLETRRFEDAERWAREGIAATSAKYPGIADHLTASLCELARKRNQWDVVAAHAARPFFEHPSLSTFDELVKAARKAGAEEPVRAAAMRFLETGTGPFQVTSQPPAAVTTPRTKPSVKKRSATTRPAASSPEPKAAAPDRLKIDPAWPLPMPDYLIPLLNRPGRYDPGPRPHLEVLLDMAIAAKRPDEVLRWFDKMRSGQQRPGYYNSPLAYTDRVAAAVSAAYPERAIEIYLAALNAQLPHAQQSAYEAATGYLKKLRPIYEALDRMSEWTAQLASIREKYRNRPRFMELLDRLDGQTIVHSTRTRRK